MYKIIEEKLKNKKFLNIALIILLVLAIGFAVYNFAAFYKEKRFKGELRFGLITDVHCYSKLNKDTNEWETNWRCTQPMRKFVEQMNSSDFQPDFVIENGDFVDGRDRLGDDGFLRANEMYEKINAPKYHVLGNHETDNFSKERWLELTGHDKTYYYFDVKGYRIIVLDGNNVLDAESEGEIIDMSPDTPHEYKGRVDEGQIVWLKKVLDESMDMKKIVFIHEPPLDETIGRVKGDIFINGKELRDIFSEGGVLAVFSGHIEELCDVDLGGVRYFSLQGFHKRNDMLPDEHQYKDQGAFYQVVVDGDRVDVEMFYSEGRDMPYQSLEVGQETAVCNNESLPSQD